MIREFLCFVIFTAFLFNAPVSLAETPLHYYYEPKLSEIAGRLELQKFVSALPPFFGEATDSKGNQAPEVTVLVLMPDQPINIVATASAGPNQDLFDDVDVIEVEAYVDPEEAKRCLGRHVRVSGYLYERTTGFEYTDVLISAKSGIPPGC